MNIDTFINSYRPKLMNKFRELRDKQEQSFYEHNFDNEAEFITDDENWMVHCYTWMLGERKSLVIDTANIQFKDPETYETTNEYINATSEIGNLNTLIYATQWFFNRNGWVIK